jgi:hypothetical protein
MEKTPNSSAPTLKLVNGPAGRDHSSVVRGEVLRDLLRVTCGNGHFPPKFG